MSNQPKILLEANGVRFVIKGEIFHNGKPDYRMQTKHPIYNTWRDSVLFDNGVQCSYAMEDPEYAKLLIGQPAYLKND
jgi:hypothetical protein